MGKNIFNNNKKTDRLIQTVGLIEKIGDYLLSHIVSQYHRRKRA